MINLSFQGRLSREQYGYWSLLVTLIVTLAACIITMMNNDVIAATLLGRLAFGLFALSFIPLVIWALVLAITLVVRRLHDTNCNGWTALWILPYACLIVLVGTYANEAVDLKFALASVQFLALIPQFLLLIIPGTASQNRFD
jgi:uncharacterized membrane protein YhaH (DUF805 family)